MSDSIKIANQQIPVPLIEAPPAEKSEAFKSFVNKPLPKPPSLNPAGAKPISRASIGPFPGERKLTFVSSPSSAGVLIGEKVPVKTSASDLEIHEELSTSSSIRPPLNSRMSSIWETFKNLMGFSSKSEIVHVDDNTLAQTYGRLGTEVVKRFDTFPNDDKKWIGSNEFRDEVGKKGFANASKSENFRIAPANMRYQQVEKDGKPVENSGFIRMGMMTDHRNGFTNLRDLRKMQQQPDLRDNLVADINRKKAELDGSKKNNFNKDQSIERAKNELGSLSSTIKEREALLQTHFFHLLERQIEQKAPNNGENFSLMHLGLLNPDKSQLDKVGWMHNEKNAMLDMAEIFSDMDGKKVIVGGDKPAHMDPEGTINLPGEGIPKELTLNTAFFNVSVQGHKESGVAAQKEVNEESLIRLEKQMIKDQVAAGKMSPQEADQRMALYEKTNKPQNLDVRLSALIDGKSNYQTAERLALRLMDHGAISINCASGKDRTGFVAARITQNKLKDANPNVSKKELSKESTKVLYKTSMASEIVFENTSTRVLKINPLNIPDLEGVSNFDRVAFLLSQVGSKIPF